MSKEKQSRIKKRMKRSKIEKYPELTGNKEHLATIEPIAVKPEQ